MPPRETYSPRALQCIEDYKRHIHMNVGVDSYHDWSGDHTTYTGPLRPSEDALVPLAPTRTLPEARALEAGSALLAYKDLDRCIGSAPVYVPVNSQSRNR